MQTIEPGMRTVEIAERRGFEGKLEYNRIYPGLPGNTGADTVYVMSSTIEHSINTARARGIESYLQEDLAKVESYTIRQIYARMQDLHYNINKDFEAFYEFPMYYHTPQTREGYTWKEINVKKTVEEARKAEKQNPSKQRLADIKDFKTQCQNWLNPPDPNNVYATQGKAIGHKEMITHLVQMRQERFPPNC
jgi:hypothetical protein